MDLFISDNTVVVDVLASQCRVSFGVEGGSSSNCGHQHTHRVSIVAETLHNRVDILVHECVGLDFFLPELELRWCGEFSVDKQESDF